MESSQPTALRNLAAWRIVAAVAAVLCIHQSANVVAQTNTAAIRGVVKDPLGGLLPGASVVATHRASGFRVERISDQAGRFFIPALPVGEYVVNVTLDGFKSVTRADVLVQLGQQVDLSITLPLGERTENLTVTGAVPLLQTANAGVSDIIDNGRVCQLVEKYARVMIRL